MKCFNGISLPNSFTVPCGQCINCRINKGRKWTGRLLLEHVFQPHHPHTYDFFLTFTYAPEHLPEAPGGPTLDKAQFCKWWKATQRSHRKFRYLAVGEYGDAYQRPHYHMVVFSATLEEAESILRAWPFGFADRQAASCLLNPQRAAYICGYTTKKLSSNHPEGYPEGVEPEFRTSTHIPAIGLAAIPSLLHLYRSTAGKAVIQERGDVERTFRFGGKIYPIAPFILDKLRQPLGIPLLHTERCDAHYQYNHINGSQEAEQCPETSRLIEERYRAKEIQRKANTQTI